MTPYFDDGTVTLWQGDCLDVLREMADESVDAVVCDPPYALANLSTVLVLEAIGAWMGGDRDYVPEGRGGFMGRAWDRFVPPPGVWDECLRVLKPGGHLLAFAAPRTVDLMGLSIRIAGFEIRDSIHWVNGSGFPKGQDIAKAIDKRREDRAEVLQVTAWLAGARDAAGWTNAQIDALWGYSGMGGLWTTQGKAAIIPQPEQWERLREAIGFDDAEIRPLVDALNAKKGTLAETWDQREVVGTRVAPERKSTHLYGDFSGDSRVTAPARDEARHWEGWNTSLKPAHEPIVVARKSTGFNTTVANVLEHGTGALNIGACRVEPTGESRPRSGEASQGRRYGKGGDDGFAVLPGVRGGDPSGRWPTNLVFTHSAACVEGEACADDCPVGELDRQSGTSTSKAGARGERHGQIYGKGVGPSGPNGVRGHNDTGGASRFFPTFRYEAKAPASERPKLPDGTAWPTVKPLALMRWLVRLVTPPGGRVLDPFAGTGTTAEAALLEGFECWLIERDQDAIELIKVRLAKPMQTGLFGGAE